MSNTMGVREYAGDLTTARRRLTPRRSSGNWSWILYTALPALLTAGSMLTFFGSGPILGTTLGVANVLWIVAAAFTVSVLPFLILVSYIVRIATVAKRTLAIGPLRLEHPFSMLRYAFVQ